MTSPAQSVTIAVGVRDAAAAQAELRKVTGSVETVGKAAQTAATEASTAFGRIDKAITGTSTKMGTLPAAMDKANAGMKAPLDKFAASGTAAGDKFAAGMQAGAAKTNLAVPVEKAAAAAAGPAAMGGTRAGEAFASGMRGGAATANLVTPVRAAGTAATTAAGVHGTAAGATFGNKMMSGFMAIGVIGLLTKSIGDTVDTYMQTAVDVNKFKRLTGGTTEQASQLSSEMTLSGVDTAKGTTSLTIFSKNLGNAAGDAKKAAAMTDLLGFSFQNVDGSVKATTDLMGPLADKFKAMPNGAEKTALAMKLFGRAGADMLPFLNRGSEGLAALAEKSDAFGLTLTDDSLAAMGDAKNQTREFDASVRGLKIGIGGALLPVMTSMHKLLSQFVIPALSSAAGFVKANSDWLIPMVAGLLSLVGAFKVAGMAVSAFNAIMKANVFVLIITAIVELAIWLKYAYEHFEGFRTFVDESWDRIQKAFAAAMVYIGPVLDWLGKALQATGEWFVWLWQEKIQPAWEGIAAAASWAWDNVIKPLFGLLWEAVQVYAQVVMWLWQNIIVPAWNGISAVISWAWDNVIKPVFGFLWDAIQVLATVVTWLWQNIITPAWNGIVAVIQWAWSAFIEPILGLIGVGLNVLGAVFTFLWRWIVQPAWDGIQNIVTFAWNNVLQPLFGWIGDGLNTLGGVFSWLWNEIVVPVWNGIGGAIQWAWDNLISPAFEFLKTGLSSVQTFFTDTKDAIGRIWDEVKEKVSAPIRWVIDMVWNNGIVPVWEKIDSWLPGDLPKLEKLDVGFAGGGVVPGYSPGNDTVNARLSPGEAVLVPELTRALLSAGVDILGANRAARGGRGGLQYFEDGGFFDNIWPDDITGLGVGKTQVTPTGDITGTNVIGDLASFTAGFMSDPLGAFMGLLGDDIRNGLKSMADSPWGQAVVQFPGQAIGSLIGIVKGWFASSSSGGDSIVGNLNLSQHPEDFGWKYPPSLADMSFKGMGLTIAAGTQGLWSALLDNLDQNIQGGVTSIGGYDDRQNVNNPSMKSFHAYGLATDVNPGQNPNGVPAYGRFGPGVIPSQLAPALANRYGMIWGGDFGGTPDGMHFEIHVGPDQISGASIAAPAGGGAMWSGTPGVEQWRALGLDVLGQVGAYRGLPLTRYIDLMLNQIRTESSGDPNAINLTDINAQNGDPSIGLLQVIGSTFRAALSGTPFEGLIAAGQRDPRASLTASTLYSLNRYGSLPAAWRGVAYDTGLDAGPWKSGTIGINTSGKDEWVLTGEQKNRLGGKNVTIAPGAIQINVGTASPTDRAALRAELERTLRGILSDDAARRF